MDHEDPILNRAFARMDELREELEKLQHFVDTYRSFANSIKLESANIEGTNRDHSDAGDSAVDNSEIETAREVGRTGAAPASRVRVRDNPKPAAVVAAAVELIRENLGPMTRRQIWEGLRDQGMVVRGADPVKALGTMLWRSGKDQLVQLEGYGYWLKHEAYEPASYHGDLF